MFLPTQTRHSSRISRSSRSRRSHRSSRSGRSRSSRSSRRSLRSDGHVSNQTARRESSASGRSNSNHGSVRVGFFHRECKEKKQVDEIEKTINREGKSVKLSDLDAARLLVVRDSLPADREFVLTANAVPGVHRSCPGQFYVARVLVPSYVEIRPWLQHILDNDFVNCRPKQESELPALMERVFDGHLAISRSVRALLNFIICMLAEEKRHPEYAQSSVLEALKRHKVDIKALAPVLTADKKRKLLPLVYKLMRSRRKQAGGSTTQMEATVTVLVLVFVIGVVLYLAWAPMIGIAFFLLFGAVPFLLVPALAAAKRGAL
jgi:hypothetical protein